MRTTTRLALSTTFVLLAGLVACGGGSGKPDATPEVAPGDADAKQDDGQAEVEVDTVSPPDTVEADEVDATPCPGDLCTSAGARECVGTSGYRVCGPADGDGCLRWGDKVACAADEACDQGACKKLCQPECDDEGATRCEGGQRQTCTAVGQKGCLTWSDTPCEAGTQCDGGACVVPCSDECPVKGLLACTDGNAVHRCGQYDDDDCLDWSPTAESCGDKVCVDGACKIPCDDECSPSGLEQCQCPDGGLDCETMTSKRTCGQFDADDCLEWKVEDCEADHKCVINALGAECALDIPCLGECTQSSDCDDQDACTVDTCNTLWCQCNHTLLGCDDGDACTSDFCKKDSGCHHVTDPLCCAQPCGSAIECNDQNACTADLCNAKGCCEHPAVGCDDGDECTLDECLPQSGCKHSKIGGCPACLNDQECDDANLCTTDKCVQVTGGVKKCQHQLKACDDGDGCTEDRCVPQTGLCQSLIPDGGGATCESVNCDGASFLCDDGVYCTNDLCSPAGDACWHYPITCENAGDPCSLGHCDEGLQMCVYDVVTPQDCEDGNFCTVDACMTFQGGCVHTPRACDDDKCCTVDACDAVSGQCVFTVNTCDDGDACTLDWCNEDKCRCEHAPTELALTCEAKGAIDPCTVWSCNPSSANCESAPKDCEDGSGCTNDSCKVVDGQGRCVHKRNTCNDSNRCTVEQCDDDTAGCYWDASGCDDRNPCTDDACSYLDGSCSYTPHDCDDGEPGTSDSCDPAVGCLYAVLTACAAGGDCNDGNKCTTDVCQGDQVCTYSLKACDDGNACTVDGCNPVTGACTHAPKNCSDGVFCSRDVCDPASGSCEHQPGLNCDDGDACTDDDCNEEFDYCIHTDVICADTSLCTEDSCDPLAGCVFPAKCDDGDPCSYDNCEPADGSCYFVKIPGCGACTLDSDCNDTQICTADVCGSQGVCLHSSASCDDQDFCTYDWCQEGVGCVHQPKANCTKCTGDASCSDGDACTSDTCGADGSCTHATLDCNDNQPCTTDLCNGLSGCLHQNKVDGLDCLIPSGGAGLCCKGVCQSAGAACP